MPLELCEEGTEAAAVWVRNFLRLRLGVRARHERERPDPPCPTISPYGFISFRMLYSVAVGYRLLMYSVFLLSVDTSPATVPKVCRAEEGPGHRER